MKETLTFIGKMDARGKIQIPRKEYQVREWTKGTFLTVTVTKEKLIAKEKQKEGEA